MSIAFFVIITVISVVSGLVHTINATGPSHIVHFGQFFAGMTFFIIALISLAACAFEGDE